MQEKDVDNLNILKKAFTVCTCKHKKGIHSLNIQREGSHSLNIQEKGVDYLNIQELHAEISPRVTATRNGRRSADLPVVPEQPEPV